MRERFRARRQLPAQQWPSGARLRYSMQLRAVTKAMRARMTKALGPTLDRLRAAEKAADALRQDARDEDLRKMLRRMAAGIAKDKRIKKIIEQTARAVANSNHRAISQQLESVGIQLLAHEPKLSRHLTEFSEQNAELIQSLTHDAADQVADLVRDGVAKGTRVEVLQKRIAERFDVSESRAELIARDQVGKLNADLTQMRQESVGITSYRWSSSRDERVRQSHRDLDGTDHDWDDPPVVDEKTGRRAHPGMDYQCRCVAIPNVEDVLRDLETIPTERASVPPKLVSVPPSLPAPPPDMTGPLEPIAVKAIGEGVHGAEVMTWRGTDGALRKGVWKSTDSELGIRPGVQPGTYHKREVALYQLDRALGGEPTVPATVSRVVRGKRGSLQRFVAGEPTSNLRRALVDDPTIVSEPTVRKMFLLDVISANDDRHAGNALWRKVKGRYRVAAIDNGLTFPEGAPLDFIFALPSNEFADAMMALDQTSVAQLRGIRLSTVADILHRAWGSERQIRETLSRIRSLQVDPQQLTRLFARGEAQWSSPETFMRDWLGTAPDERVGLTSADHAQIRKLSRRRRP